MKTYYFRDLVKIEAENLTGPQIKEYEKMYGELRAVNIPRQGLLLVHDKSGLTNKDMKGSFLDSMKKYRVEKG